MFPGASLFDLCIILTYTFDLCNSVEVDRAFFILQQKITSCACLIGSGLKLIFH